MLKKSEVNSTIAIGVIAAHTYKLMTTSRASIDIEEIKEMANALSLAVLAVDCGYSCSQDDLEKEIASISAESETPQFVFAALKARALFKEIEPLSEEERNKKLGALMVEKMQSMMGK